VRSRTVACCVEVVIEPAGMGGQVASSCSHLVNPTRHEFPWTHKWVWGEGGGVLVVRGRGRISNPVLEKHVPSMVPEGPVGLCHEFGVRDLCPGWREGV